MHILSINYKIKKASAKEINLHLEECKYNFNPPLDHRVNIQEYSRKIFEKAITFEAWLGNVLAGLAAAYFNDWEHKRGYISDVSIIKDYQGMDIASVLMQMCIDYANKHHFKEVELEVHKKNTPAIKLYKKFGFQFFEDKNGFVVMKYETILV
jgi:ribosomal protein S18 acetylase RimI-like enzyme